MNGGFVYTMMLQPRSKTGSLAWYDGTVKEPCIYVAYIVYIHPRRDPCSCNDYLQIWRRSASLIHSADGLCCQVQRRPLASTNLTERMPLTALWSVQDRNHRTTTASSSRSISPHICNFRDFLCIRTFLNGTSRSFFSDKWATYHHLAFMLLTGPIHRPTLPSTS